ncbi:MAG: AAA family ATPase [FCB group bacterium]|jgi:hypothetical protein|nr:AAA family ATPase [FCB group bacterium]
MANFPVFDRVRVQNYAMYVGTPSSPGLDHAFRSGVNVIVGINGLGKTTLLNILLRALTGASDIPGDGGLGDKKRRLVPADRSWFRRRVPDDAVSAEVTIWFHIGVNYFELTRSLANLDILRLSVDQQCVPSTSPTEFEAAYREHVIQAAGLSSFDDFVFLLRYVVFYLEDRRSLVWDPAAQGDILGILFGEQGANRKEYVELFNELLSKDSEYRNMFAVVNKRRKEVEKQVGSIEGGQVDMLIKTLEERRKELSELAEHKRDVARDRDSLREQIENRRREIHDRRAELSFRLNTFYESFFPSVNDAGRYLLAHFDAGAGCLVCGSREGQAVARVAARLHINTCPMCESAIENDSSAKVHDPNAGALIEEQRAAIAQAERDLAAMLTPLEDAERDYSETAARLVAVTADVMSLEQQLQKFGQTIPDAVEKRNELQQRLLSFEAALNQIDVERIELTGQFRALASAIDREVQSVSAQVEEKFGKYIQGFLAERCHVKYTPRQSRIGQRTATESFPFPHFVPALTSGVHRNNATVRELGQSVSESQKEFIDLAFRMALLELAAPDTPAMLVLETPEASLDSVFVPRAADLLRRFASRTNGAAATKLIASSNVNREQMIPALFGAYPDRRFYGQVVDEAPQDTPATVPMEERAKHVLDLLSIAAPTRALDRFREAYEEERDHAIYPEQYAVASS